MTHHQPDLVHVRGDHDLLRIFCIFRWTFASNEIAERVHFDLVGERLHFRAHHLTDIILITRGSKCFGQLFEERLHLREILGGGKIVIG